jgi:hypothetical protein
MSAGRSASSLLFTLIATIVLFAVFAGISSLNVLEKHAYMPGFGWNQPADTASGLHGVCDIDTSTRGFPIAATRQAAPPDDCLKVKNPLAQAMNYALYFAVAGIISVGAVEGVRSRLP